MLKVARDWERHVVEVQTESSPAVANGVVYTGSGGAFSAAGTKGCSGTPPNKTCGPLWTAANGGSALASPAVANGMVYEAQFNGPLSAYKLP